MKQIQSYIVSSITVETFHIIFCVVALYTSHFRTNMCSAGFCLEPSNMM